MNFAPTKPIDLALILTYEKSCRVEPRLGESDAKVIVAYISLLWMFHKCLSIEGKPCVTIGILIELSHDTLIESLLDGGERERS